MYFYKSKLHELAIHFDEDAQQLELGQLATASDSDHGAVGVSLNPLYVRTLLAFIDDCHSILNVILAADTQVLRAMPILTILRTPYAFKALAMLEKRSARPNDAIGKVIDQQSLKWQYYARNVSQVLEGGSQGGLYVVPKVALRMRDSTVKTQQLKSITGASIQLHQAGQAPTMALDWQPKDGGDFEKTLSIDMDHLPFQNNLMEFDFVMEPWENELWANNLVGH